MFGQQPPNNNSPANPSSTPSSLFSGNNPPYPSSTGLFGNVNTSSTLFARGTNPASSQGPFKNNPPSAPSSNTAPPLFSGTLFGDPMAARDIKPKDDQPKNTKP